MIPTHPVAVPGRPDTLRWLVPPDWVRAAGPVLAVPGALGQLLAAGRIESIEVTATGVLITLPDPADWSSVGPQVRTALHAALADPDGWAVADVDADELIGQLARAELAGRGGDYLRSHGGRAEVVEVRDGVVSVRLSGACSGCPALGRTLSTHIESTLRRRCPGIRAVHAVA